MKFPHFLLLILLFVRAAAQDADDPGENAELALQRLLFERAWIVATVGPVKKQITTLDALEKQLATARDYDGAARVRLQRLEMQNELDRLDKNLVLLQSREQALKASLLPARIQLPLEAAQLTGGTRLDSGALTGWARGATATWKLPAGLPPGGYEVILRYRCGPLEGGSLTLSEKRFTLSTAIETTLRGAENREAGTLKLSEGATTLTLTAASVFKDNLMQLLAIDLLPTASR